VRVIVTRPAAQAASWVAQLQGRGIDAAALPLIDIGPPVDAAAVSAAWLSLAQQRLVFFVSPNAAECFFAARPEALAWPDRVQAACPGPGTSAVLRRSGVPAALIVEPPVDAPQFDSEAVWNVLQTQAWSGAAVLVVRGDGGRDWLAEQLGRCGAQVNFVAAYRRVAARVEADGLKLLHAALAAPEAHLWFFSSSEAIAHLGDLPAVRASVQPWAHAQALATHPRIAERAQHAGFGRVWVSRATLDAVVACIQSTHRE
jgi:uroporphyrinogen-III synthase